VPSADPANPSGAPAPIGGTALAGRLADEGPAGWQRQSSPVARYAWTAYVGLVLYASLYPWTGWRDLGVPAWAYLRAPWPLYLTQFDLLTNLLLYAPLGMLTPLALYPLLRGWKAWLAAVAAGALLSGCIEAVQTFLPERISSNVDLLANVAGAALGGALGVRCAQGLIDRGWLFEIRMRWFERDASGGIVIVALWGAAQWAPQLLLFGNGDVTAVLSDAYRWLFDVYGFNRIWSWTPGLVGVAEAATSALGVLSVGLLSSVLLRPLSPRLRILLGWLTLTLILKAALQRLVFRDSAASLWLTEAGAAGAAFGLVAHVALLALPRKTRATLALCAVVLSLVVVNFAPESDYIAAKLESLRPHRWQWGNFSGLLDMIALIWPFAAWVYLARLRRRL
jgi:VanZ family protein